MTGNRSFFSELKECASRYITFGDGTKGRIIVKCNIENVIQIMNDHEKEFENEELNNFCEEEGIHHEYSAPLTSQQNGVV